MNLHQPIISSCSKHKSIAHEIPTTFTGNQLKTVNGESLIITDADDTNVEINLELDYNDIKDNLNIENWAYQNQQSKPFYTKTESENVFIKKDQLKPYVFKDIPDQFYTKTESDLKYITKTDFTTFRNNVETWAFTTNVNKPFVLKSELKNNITEVIKQSDIINKDDLQPWIFKSQVSQIPFSYKNHTHDEYVTRTELNQSELNSNSKFQPWVFIQNKSLIPFADKNHTHEEYALKSDLTNITNNFITNENLDSRISNLNINITKNFATKNDIQSLTNLNQLVNSAETGTVLTKTASGLDFKPSSGITPAQANSIKKFDAINTQGQVGYVLTKTSSGMEWQQSNEGLTTDQSNSIRNISYILLGGSENQVLTKTSSGPAWKYPQTGTTECATTESDGLMSSGDKTKLDSLTQINVDNTLNQSSSNPVQNKVIYNALSKKIELNTNLQGTGGSCTLKDLVDYYLAHKNDTPSAPSTGEKVWVTYVVRDQILTMDHVEKGSIVIPPPVDNISGISGWNYNFENPITQDTIIYAVEDENNVKGWGLGDELPMILS